ncbi:MAG: hypothetical protein NT099_00675 [Candidatus Saganbacteria bacterium]|nr:hypothetical protein [Candidatus Saganbacteria bacterium]
MGKVLRPALEYWQSPPMRGKTAVERKPVFVTAPPFLVDEKEWQAVKGLQVFSRPQTRVLAEAERMIVEILDGKHKGEVVEVEEGYRVSDPKLVRSVLDFSHFEYVSCFEARLDVIRTLTQLGYDVLVITAAKKKEGRYEIDETQPFNQAALNNGATWLLGNVGMPQHLWKFPRDMFFQAGNTLCFHQDTNSFTWPLRLGFQGEIQLAWPIGGGEFLGAGKFALTGKPKEEKNVIEMQAMLGRLADAEGIRAIYTLPFCWVDAIDPKVMQDSFGTQKRILIPHAHIDFAVSLNAPKGVLVSRPSYFHDNRTLLSRVADREKLDLRVLPSDSWYAVNVLVLPDGSVVADRSETEANRFFADFTTVHETAQPYGGMGLGGGILCSVNMLWVLRQKQGTLG